MLLIVVVVMVVVMTVVVVVVVVVEVVDVAGAVVVVTGTFGRSSASTVGGSGARAVDAGAAGPLDPSGVVKLSSGAARSPEGAGPAIGTTTSGVAPQPVVRTAIAMPRAEHRW